MSKKWNDFANSSAYQNLSDEEKQSAQQRYYEAVIYPEVAGTPDAQSAREKFLRVANPTVTDKALELGGKAVDATLSLGGEAIAGAASLAKRGINAIANTDVSKLNLDPAAAAQAKQIEKQRGSSSLMAGKDGAPATAPTAEGDQALNNVLDQAAVDNAPIDADIQASADQVPHMKPEGFSEVAGNALARTVKNTTAMNKGIVALGLDVVGADETALSVLKSAVKTQNESAGYPAAVEDFTNIQSWGDVPTYVLEGVLENSGMLVQSVFAGGVGAGIAKGLGKEKMESMLAGAAKKELAKRVAIGSAAGAGASSIGMESGSIYNDIYSETGEMRPAVALAFGTLAGSLDAIPAARAVRTALGGKLVEEAGKSLIKRYGVEGAKQIIEEGGTEFLQTWVEKGAVSYVDGREVLNEKNLIEATDAMLKGGAAGGATHIAAQGFNDAVNAGDPEARAAEQAKQRALGAWNNNGLNAVSDPNLSAQKAERLKTLPDQNLTNLRKTAETINPADVPVIDAEIERRANLGTLSRASEAGLREEAKQQNEAIDAAELYGADPINAVNGEPNAITDGSQINAIGLPGGAVEAQSDNVSGGVGVGAINVPDLAGTTLSSDGQGGTILPSAGGSDAVAQGISTDPKYSAEDSSTIQAQEAAAIDSQMPEMTQAAPVVAAGAVEQNRNRSSATSIQQMKAIAKAPDFYRAGISNDMQTGSPVVVSNNDEQMADAVYGTNDVTVDGKGNRYDTQYAVIDADKVNASHDVEGNENTAYTNKVDGAFRSIAGNGRTAGIQQAYKQGTAKQYKADLISKAGTVGIDAAKIKGMKSPLLVRVMKSSQLTDDIGDLSNISQTAQLSPVEQARTDAHRLDLGALEFTDDGDVSSNVIMQWVSTLPQTEQSGLTSNGRITTQATDRLNAAIFFKAYGSDELTRLYAEAVDQESRNVISAIGAAAPILAQLEGRGDLDVRGAVVEAAGIIVSAKRSKGTVAEYMNNLDAFVSAEARVLAQFFFENINAKRKLADGLKDWSNYVLDNSKSTNQSIMFEEAAPKTRAQLFERFSDGKQQGQQQSEGSATTGQGTQQETNERAGQAETARGSEGIQLQGQTNEEINAALAKQEADAKAKRDEEAKAKAEQSVKDKSDVESRLKAAAANPDNFVFGEGKKDVTKADVDLFGARNDAPKDDYQVTEIKQGALVTLKGSDQQHTVRNTYTLGELKAGEKISLRTEAMIGKVFSAEVSEIETVNGNKYTPSNANKAEINKPSSIDELKQLRQELSEKIQAQGTVTNARDEDRIKQVNDAILEAEDKESVDADKAKAQSDLDSALGDLGDIFGKTYRKNITQEQEQKLIPVLTRVFDAAFRLGYYEFKDAAKFVIDTIRSKIGADIAETVNIDQLQGAYISMAGKYGDKATKKRDVVNVESIAEILEGNQNARTTQDQDLPNGSTQSNLLTEQPRSGDSKSMDARVGGSSEKTDADGDVSSGISETSGNGTSSVSGSNRNEPSSGSRKTSNAGNKSSTTNVNDFEITDETGVGEGSLAQKYKDNISVIKLIKALESESRIATPEERSILAKYSGWGALSKAFEKGNKNYDELKALLTDEEYAAAKSSILNAYFTSPTIVKAMYDAVQHLGFKHGRVLEPSLGSGNFFGMMPAAMRNKSKLNGVELDVITSRLAKYLYPNANVAVATGFEKYQAPQGYFDLVVSNPPFGSEKIVDNDRSDYSGFSIHNYFIAKSIDKLRDDGLLAVVVTHGFMDAMDSKAREWISKRAILRGAVRLPNTAFKDNAGTEVITDILFFQKTNMPEVNPDWVKSSDHGDYFFNDYFSANPMNVLGRVDDITSQYGKTYTVAPTGDTAKLIKEFIAARLPANVYIEPENRVEVLDSADSTVPDGVKVGTFYKDDKGMIRQRMPDMLGARRSVTWEVPNSKAQDRMLGMMALRDLLRTQMRLERDGMSSDKEIERNRERLNLRYDAFLKEYGYLNSMTNRRLFLDDTESALLQAIEMDYDQGVTAAKALSTGMDKKEPSAKKADILTRRVLFPPSDSITVSTAKDALLASLNVKGNVDIDYMADVYSKSKEEIISELGDVVYNDPNKGYVTADDYLSGDVKTKLTEAKSAVKTNQEFSRNVEALEKVIPKDKMPSEIYASAGANWIPADVYEAFASEITGIPQKNIEFTYVNAAAMWLNEKSSGGDMGKMTAEYGTQDINSYDLFTMVVNGKSPEVKETIIINGERKSVTNIEKTEAARSKYEKVKETWNSWIFKDADRADRLASIYNDKHNRVVARKYDGSHMQFYGMSPSVTLRPHQSDVVWRAIQDRNVLLDHVVGAGKTMAMASIAMEMKRLGIARKPMFVVPNHLTLQWRSEFTKLYPASNILAATPDDFAKDKREKMFSKMVTGDYDAIIVGHSSLTKVGLPAEVEEKMYQEQIDEIADAIETAKSARGDRGITRDMEKIKKNLEAKIEKLKQKSGVKDKVVTFDELGIDALFIDEMHEFKNLFFTTQMQRTAGLGNPAGSGKALDLFMKVKFMQDTFGEDAPLITATGTPVSNSLAEMYTMQRYMKYKQMKRDNLHMFDAWAKQFGEVENVYEVAPSGVGYRQSTRFSKFKNLPALMGSYTSFADIITMQDLKDQSTAAGKVFPVPKLRTGKPINVIAQRSELQRDFFGVPQLAVNEATGEIQFEVNPVTATIEQNKEGKFVLRHDNGSSLHETKEEAELELVSKSLQPKTFIDPDSLLGKFANLAQLTRDSKGKINALSLTGLANKSGLDYRIIDPNAPDFSGSKINIAVTNMVSLWKETAKDKGAQIVFCDMSIPNSARSDMSSKERRIYVRDKNGELTHKAKGVVYAPEGYEGFPFYISKSRNGFEVFEAVTGVSMRDWGLDDRASAKEWIKSYVESESNRDRIFTFRDSRTLDQSEIDEYRDAQELEVADDFSNEITLADLEAVAGSSSFSVYDDIKAKLIKQGVPENQIAFIHDFNTPKQKEELFKRVNNGDVRFLFGSTPKLGAGTNVQKRLVGLHHIDAPWRPSDLEQREGRIIRQGNELYANDPDGFEIAIWRYATEQTYDTRRWQLLEHKAAGIEQLRKYTGEAEIEDVASEASNSADMKAAASGNPLILEETKLRTEKKRLINLEKSHADSLYAMARKIKQNESYANDVLPNRIAGYKELIRSAESYPMPADKLKIADIVIDGKRVGTKEAAENELGIVTSKVKNAFNLGDVKVIKYRGVDFTVERGFMLGSLKLSSPDGTMHTYGEKEGVSPSGLITRFNNYIDSLETRIEDAEAKIDKALKDNESLSQRVGDMFEFADKLKEVQAEHTNVQRRLMKSSSLEAIPKNQRTEFDRLVKSRKEELKSLGYENALKKSESDSDDAAFSLSDETSVKGLPVATVEAMVKKVSKGWKNTPTVYVITSLQDPRVPENVRAKDAELKSRGSKGNPIGFISKGKVYVMASMVSSEADVAEVIMHEIFGHYGLRGNFGDVLSNVLEQMIVVKGDLVRTKAAQYKLDYTNKSERLQAAEEVLAEMAQTNPSLGFVKRAIAAIRTWLRKNIAYYKNLEITDDEIINNILIPARNFVKDRVRNKNDDPLGFGKLKPVYKSNGVSFSMRDQTNTPQFKKWFGDSKVVDADGKPLVVYHGTDKVFNEFRISKNGIFGRGAYFTTSKDGASDYAYSNGNNYGEIMPVYLSISNPYKIDFRDTWSDLYEKLLDEEPANPDKEYPSIRQEKQIFEALTNDGYDGFEVYGAGDYSDQTYYIAFKPNQVKSATDNNGDFDPDNNDIRFSRTNPEAGAGNARPVAKEGGAFDRLLQIAGKPFAKHVTQPLYRKAAELLDSKYLLGSNAGKIIKAGMIADYGLDEQYLDRRDEIEARMNAHLRKSKNLIQSIAGLSRQESRIAYQWLQEKPDTDAEQALMDQLPADSIAFLEQIKTMIEDLSQEAIALGQLKPEQYERNKYSYLHRSYAKYEIEAEERKDMKAGARRRVLGDQYKGRGLQFMVDPERLDTGESDNPIEKGMKFVRLESRNEAGILTKRVWWNASVEVPPMYRDLEVDPVQWEVRGDKKGKVILWRDFTKEERERMGELDEAKFAVAMTVSKMAHDIEIGKFFEFVDGTYAQDEAPEGSIVVDNAGESAWSKGNLVDALAEGAWVKVPDTKIQGTDVEKYGAISGKYVSGAIWNDIRQIMNTPSVPQWYSTVMRFWKVSKTALSPAVHLNNVMSNMIMADMHDVQARHLVKAIDVMWKSRKDADAKAFIERFEDSGAVAGTYVHAELKDDMMKPLLEELRREIAGTQSATDQMHTIANALSVMYKEYHDKGIRKGMSMMATTKAARLATAIPETMINIYQNEDVIFRLAAFIKGLDQGKTDRESGKEARKAFLDYRINAPWIQNLRQTVLPFVAFTYRMIPMYIETMRDKPWKIAKYMIIANALAAVGMAMAGIGDDDDDEIQKLLPEDRKGLTPFMTQRQIPVGKDKNGNIVYLDTTRWVPLGDIFELQGESSNTMPMAGFANPAGVIMLIGDLFWNRSRFTGRDVWQNTDTTSEAAGKVTEAFWKGMAPNNPLLPYTYSSDKIANAYGDKVDMMGRDYSMSQALASSFGIKVNTYDKKQLEYNKRQEIKADQREITGNMSMLSIEYGRKGITKEQYKERMKNEQVKLNGTVKDL